MAWSQILAHEREKKILQRQLSENRIAGAYLFWGTDGIGKEAMAIELAKAANCIEPIIEEDRYEACDECKNCRQISKINHPNINYVFPVPTGKTADSRSDSAISKLSEEQLNEINNQVRLKSENYYHKITITNANQIRIAQIRDIRKSLSMSSSRGGRRFVIISSAEKMNPEAANAFLKTLEEPNPNTTLILTTSRNDYLLETIRSRCQQLRFGPIPDDLIIKYILDNYNNDENEARLAAVFAQGSLLRAVDALSEDMKSRRSAIVELLRASFKKKIFRSESLEIIDEMIAVNNKEELNLLLNLMMIWLRDASAIKISEDAMLYNEDQRETIKKFSSIFPHANYGDAIDAVENALLKIRQNVNPRLAFVDLIISLRRNILAIY